MQPITSILLLYFCLICAGCGHKTARITENNRAEGNGATYAKRFRIETKNGYSILTINNPWQGARNVHHTFYLINKDEKEPEGINPDQILYVPVERIISMSTTYLSMIYALGAENSIVGISGGDLLFNESLREKVKRGEVADVGFEGNLNKEMIINLSPDLVMVYGVGGEASGYLNKLRDLGIKVLFNADYLEEEPLGKAEWIKVFGALYCREDEAEKIFSRVADEYNSVRAIINERSSSRPKVMLGLPWKDTWYISPGNSFVSRLIMDAGGDYLWRETTSGTSMPYGVENVWMKAREADYWLNISTVSSHEEILNTDRRLAGIEAYKKGNLFNNNKRIALNGGNDFWESGSVNPQIILKDIASILHPELFPGHELYYYKKVK